MHAFAVRYENQQFGTQSFHEVQNADQLLFGQNALITFGRFTTGGSVKIGISFAGLCAGYTHPNRAELLGKRTQFVII